MLVADDFRPDEAAGDVAVDLARGQHRGHVARDRPAAFILADREERDTEQVVARPDDAVEP
jgi:hypothetical protein